MVRTPLTGGVMDGALKTPGVDLVVNEATSVNRNSREMVQGKYDIAEMSLATYFKAREDGLPFTGIPVFTGRRFVQPGIHVRPGAGIKTPADLAGRRVAVPQFWMTSSVWHRIYLSRECGIRADQVRWVTLATERLKSAIYPPGLDVTLIEGRLPGEVLADGTVDAVLVPKHGGRLIGKIPYETPFQDLVAAQRESFSATGVFPIMHFVVMRSEVAKAVPSLAADLFNAFVVGKAAAMEGAVGLENMEEPIWGQTVAAALPLFGGDPWPYGIAANRRTLDVFQDSLLEQGLLRTRVPLETLFEVDAAGTEMAS
jgi:4,5-dihydroxyphthalate decarboxylase